ncbi:hypothetical protein BIV02_12530 [Curtobacterium sp. MMLR14_014]|nr:hypothetical protein BIU91_04770 [Curtobacterium sp. MMLR14_002]OII45500.1 hypothetical protein BIV02_12530 [Curtobacterium sp. MMLR14_014]
MHLRRYHLAMAEAGLLAASIAVLVGTVAILVHRVRTPAWVRDVQLTLNASPVTSLLLLLAGALLVALVLAFGIFLLATRHSVVGWAIVCLAATGIAHLGVTVWIRRQPLS